MSELHSLFFSEEAFLSLEMAYIKEGNDVYSTAA